MKGSKLICTKYLLLLAYYSSSIQLIWLTDVPGQMTYFQSARKAIIQSLFSTHRACFSCIRALFTLTAMLLSCHSDSLVSETELIAVVCFEPYMFNLKVDYEQQLPFYFMRERKFTTRLFHVPSRVRFRIISPFPTCTKHCFAYFVISLRFYHSACGTPKMHN